jgi:hypothetical protein
MTEMENGHEDKYSPQYTNPLSLQNKLYFLNEQLQLMVRDLPP